MPDLGSRDMLPPLPARFRLSPEFRLLLASAWIAPPACRGAQAERIEAAHRDGVDWGAFFALIDRHRVVVPLETLREALGARLPDRVSEQLAARKAEACRVALRQLAELARLSRVFAGRGIDLLPLKGVMLSWQLFGDPAMRSTRDLDLLVRSQCLDAAGEVLREEGYRCLFPDFDLTPRRRQWVLRHSSHFVYRSDDRGQLIELHWRLPQWQADHVAELWDHRRMVTLAGTSLPGLNDEALLLFLCDHGAKHEWCRAKWLVDVAALFAQERRLSWEQVLVLADRCNLTRPLAQAGLLMHWLFTLPIPHPLRNLIVREDCSPSAMRAVHALLQSDQESLALPGRLRSAVNMVRRRPGSPRFDSLRSCMISTDEFKECPLPDWLFWLYFPLRPLLWFYHYYIKGMA